ncbi:MAG: hypothetical protein COC22_06685 [Flavobacteriaceae bacterium]|nr:MAG: hypothetical protein COC22_06685 [Flavobacteriaceae bacterium]
MSTKQELNNSYFNFFENAPVALCIEDFSEVKNYVEKEILKNNLDIKSFISGNPEVVQKLSSLVKIKEVNATAVKLYKAKDKSHLIKNVTNVFTEKSFLGFSQLVTAILTGEKEFSIITINKTLEGEKFDVLIKFSVEAENNTLENVIISAENITDTINSNKKLGTTKNLFSNILSSIKDGFVILDNNSNYLYINQEAANLLNIKNTEDLVGKNIWNEFPEKEGDIFYDFYHKALKTRKPIQFENYFKPWNCWFENRIIPSNEGMLLFFHEITHKKKSEKKIKEAYNIINKSSSVAILCKNERDFPVEFVSENTLKLFGYSSSELRLNKIPIHQVVHPEDKKRIGAEFIKLSKGEYPKGIRLSRFRIITKEEQVKWVRCNADAILNDDGEITHVQGIIEDITEKKKTEDLFFESNQRLKEQFNNTPLGSIIWDLDFNVLEWNDSAYKIFGYTSKEAIGSPIKNLITPPHLTSKMEEVLETFLAQKEGFKSTNENVTKNGQIITCNWYNVGLRDIEGNLIGMASLVDDVTERINTKRIIEKSEKKYRDIFEKTIDAVLILKNNHFIDCNKSTLKMFDYSNKQSILQLHLSKISPERQLNGESSFIKAERMMKIALENGSNRFRWDHQRKDGRIFPAEVSLTRIDNNSKSPTIHAVIKDITERVKNEELENVLYNISKAALTISNFKEFGLFVKNKLHKIIDTSNFYIALYNKETDTFTRPFYADEKDEIESFAAAGTLTGYVVKTKKTLMVNKDSHAELIRKGVVSLVGAETKIWIGVPLKTKENVFGAIVVQSYINEKVYSENDVQLLEFVADQISTIIQRKKAENELKIALTKAQESDRLKSSFLANMSHEIRTPMNGIIGFSELFLEAGLSEQERIKYANIVINSSKRLLSIVNDILDISKIEAGMVKLNYENVNLNKLLDNLYTFYKPKATECNLELKYIKGLENFKSTIEIDKTKLSQILTNLLSNAFKFTNEGSVEFGYQLIADNLQFYVKDTGVGIEKNLQSQIFDRFIQANVDLVKKHKGTGLGLAISKKFIELFKGEIWMDSNNKGTTIYFTIPYIKAKTSLITSVVEDKKPIFKVKKQELTILVAEDEEYNMMYIHELFSKTNFKIIEADNGKKAIDLFDKHPEIDLILMDIKMPIMDGNAAMKAIKKKKPTLPIIALSAFAMESDKKEAIKEGFDAYLTKPIDRKLLFSIIGKYTS